MFNSTYTMMADGRASYHILRSSKNDWSKKCPRKQKKVEALFSSVASLVRHSPLSRRRGQPMSDTKTDTASTLADNKITCTHHDCQRNARAGRGSCLTRPRVPRPHCLSQWRLLVYWPFAIGSEHISCSKFLVRFYASVSRARLTNSKL